MNMSINDTKLKHVPVLLLGYNRPELILQRVKELKKNNVQHLYISIDGSRAPIKGMTYCLEEVRNLYSGSGCLTIIEQEKNLGLAFHISSQISYLITKHQRLIILEDDISIGENFLLNMEKGIDYLKDKSHKGVVCGFSPIINYKNFIKKNKWRTTIYFHCWGWLCTEEIWKLYKLDISEENLILELSNSNSWNKLNKWQKHLWLSRFAKIQKNPFHTWDIQFQYMCFKYSLTNCAPFVSLTNNYGFDDQRSEHTKGKKPRWWLPGNPSPLVINSEVSKIVQLIFEKVIEPLTTAGDSRLIRIRNRYRT